MSSTVDDHLREVPVRRTPVHAGRLLHVYDDEVRLSDGTAAHREVVEHPGAVTVVALDADDRVVLVRQWRHPVGRALWELPAGTRDHAEESPRAAAERELAEETGFRAGEWRDLAIAPLTPGYSSELMHFFAARRLEGGVQQMDPDERLDVERFSRDEVARLARDGEIDVKTLAGLSLVGWSFGVDG